MAFLKGKSPLFFVIGFALIIIAAIVYWKSEALAGVENIQLGKTLEGWAIGLGVAGLVSLILMFAFDSSKKKGG